MMFWKFTMGQIFCRPCLDLTMAHRCPSFYLAAVILYTFYLQQTIVVLITVSRFIMKVSDANIYFLIFLFCFPCFWYYLVSLREPMRMLMGYKVCVSVISIIGFFQQYLCNIIMKGNTKEM